MRWKNAKVHLFNKTLATKIKLNANCPLEREQEARERDKTDWLKN